MHVPLDDAYPTEDECRIALKAGRNVARKVQQGQRVLVTCHAGLNRSGLVTGLALINLGMPAETAIQKIRSARGTWALSNRHFSELLRIHGSVIQGA